jgi:hypothetical protein
MLEFSYQRGEVGITEHDSPAEIETFRVCVGEPGDEVAHLDLEVGEAWDVGGADEIGGEAVGEPDTVLADHCSEVLSALHEAVQLGTDEAVAARTTPSS